MFVNVNFHFSYAVLRYLSAYQLYIEQPRAFLTISSEFTKTSHNLHNRFTFTCYYCYQRRGGCIWAIYRTLGFQFWLQYW